MAYGKLMKVLKDPKIIVITILLILVLGIVLLNPNFFREKKVFDIPDKCGTFVNLISHTVEDEDKCISRCRAQCYSIDYKFDKVEFSDQDLGCNTCKCYCK